MIPRPVPVRVLVGALLPALVVLSAGGAQPPDGPPVAAPDKASYRFRELHGLSPGQDVAKLAPQYRVTSQETIVLSRASSARGPKPAPKRSTLAYAWSERIAAVDPYTKDVTGVLRRYDPSPPAPAPAAGAAAAPGPNLEGLLLWVQPQAMRPPLVMQLTAGRSLEEREYQAIVTHPFVPGLAGLLPALPVRVGEDWAVGVGPAEGLLRVPLQGAELRAKLLSVRPLGGESDPRRNAEFQVSGKAQRAGGGVVALEARIEFEFLPTPPSLRSSDPDLLYATGSIALVRLGQAEALRAEPGLGKGTLNRQMVLKRALTTTEPIELPNPMPVPSVENTWIVLTAPDGAWHLRHPQDFVPHSNPETGGLDLVRERGDVPDVVSLKPEKGTALDVSTLRLRRQERWRQEGVAYRDAGTAILPPIEWPGFANAKRFSATLGQAEVARISAPTEGPPPVTFYGYVLNANAPTKGSVYAEAMTGQADPLPFQRDAETVLKGLKFGRPVPVAAPKEGDATAPKTPSPSPPS